MAALFDQLCSVYLFRLYRACVKLSLVIFYVKTEIVDGGFNLQ